MDFDEYAERQRIIVETLLGFIVRRLFPYLAPKLTFRDWLVILEDLYPPVEDARYESAELARTFYDDVREQNGLEPNPIDLASYKFEWFQEAMEPTRVRLVEEDSTEEDLGEIAAQIAREVENGGRKTMIRGVQNEPSEEPHDEIKYADEPDQGLPEGKVRRWARVPTGRETCGFCLMLVSRGPVYFSARDAGLQTDDSTAAKLIAQGDQKAIKAYMNDWHPKCDCKVVPVYDFSDWPGRDTYKYYEKLWGEVASGTDDPLNAFRRYIEDRQKPGDRKVDEPQIAA